MIQNVSMWMKDNWNTSTDFTHIGKSEYSYTLELILAVKWEDSNNLYINWWELIITALCSASAC